MGLERYDSCNMSPSSRGLGHCPFTAATGVRIPLGTPTAASTGPLRRARFFCAHAVPWRNNDGVTERCRRAAEKYFQHGTRACSAHLLARLPIGERWPGGNRGTVACIDRRLGPPMAARGRGPRRRQRRSRRQHQPPRREADLRQRRACADAEEPADCSDRSRSVARPTHCTRTCPAPADRRRRCVRPSGRSRRSCQVPAEVAAAVAARWVQPCNPSRCKRRSRTRAPGACSWPQPLGLTLTLATLTLALALRLALVFARATSAATCGFASLIALRTHVPSSGSIGSAAKQALRAASRM